MLCTARDPCVDGRAWECPIVTELPPLFNSTTPTTTNSHDSKTPSCRGNLSTNSSSSSSQRSHLFSVSAGSSPAICWLGRYHTAAAAVGGGGGAAGGGGGRGCVFDLASADGPHPLDLGDLLYAPNVLTDTQVCGGGYGSVCDLWGLGRRPT